MADHTRTVAACTRCGSIYAARVVSDGLVRPIGTTVCSCGSETFQPLR